MVFGTLLGLKNLPDLIISLIVLGELTGDIGISREACVLSSLTDFTGFHQPIILDFTQQSWTLTKEGRQTRGMRRIAYGLRSMGQKGCDPSTFHV
jgi:hypothetical protein